MKYKVLILGPHLSEKGGVSFFISLLFEQLHTACQDYSYFAVGFRKSTGYRIFFLIYFLADLCRYSTLLFRYAYPVVHMNPSFVVKSLARDTIYALMAKAFNHKLVFFIHGWSTSMYSKLASDNITKHLLKIVLLLADRIIVLSDVFKQRLMQIGICPSSIEVLPIMVDYRRFSQRNMRIANTSIRYILFLSDFFKDKGLYEVIRAVPLVLSDSSMRNSLKFILAGDGPEMKEAKEMVRALGISDYVQFTGYVMGEEKYDVFKSAAIFVFPTSHGEGFPTVIAEAMASGLPIIATGVGAIPEVIEDGVNGIILSKPDERELADAILWLLHRPRLMKRMGIINRNKAKAYDASVVSRKLMTIYNEVAASRA